MDNRHQLEKDLKDEGWVKLKKVTSAYRKEMTDADAQRQDKTYEVLIDHITQDGECQFAISKVVAPNEVEDDKYVGLKLLEVGSDSDSDNE